jgi:hypothetical protein
MLRWERKRFRCLYTYLKIIRRHILEDRNFNYFLNYRIVRLSLTLDLFDGVKTCFYPFIKFQSHGTHPLKFRARIEQTMDVPSDNDISHDSKHKSTVTYSWISKECQHLVETEQSREKPLSTFSALEHPWSFLVRILMRNQKVITAYICAEFFVSLAVQTVALWSCDTIALEDGGRIFMWNNNSLNFGILR